MFGKRSSKPGEIDVSDLDFLDNAQEFARLWYTADDGMVFLIDPHNLGPDPFMFGMALVDAARHGAKAYAQSVNISEDEAMARIWEGFDAERGNPTDAPKQINPEGRSH